MQGCTSTNPWVQSIVQVHDVEGGHHCNPQALKSLQMLGTLLKMWRFQSKKKETRIKAYHRHHPKGGQHLLSNNWWHPIMHTFEVHQNLLLCFVKEKEVLCSANIFTMCSCFYGRWIMTLTNSFTVQHIPITRSCNYLNWLILSSATSDASVVFTILLWNVSTWHYIFEKS